MRPIYTFVIDQDPIAQFEPLFKKKTDMNEY